MRQLLIDGDIVLYKVAMANEVETHWGDGLWTLHSDEKVCQVQVDDVISNLLTELEADDYIVCLTDAINFRKDIMPSYKGNRKDKRKPLVFSKLREYIFEHHYGVTYDGLEADDVMGILSTEPAEEERVIVSIDKDLKQIPGLLSSDGKTIKEVNRAQADYWFLIQTLAGDLTDGYSGCPGIGVKTAEKLLDIKVPLVDNWSRVVKAYKKKDYLDGEILQQARVARILRHGEYDHTTGAVKLWKI
jgi:DNA polymerase-1